MGKGLLRICIKNLMLTQPRSTRYPMGKKQEARGGKNPGP